MRTPTTYIKSGSGILAVRPFTDARGTVHVAGYGATRRKALEACGNLMAELDHEGHKCA